MKQFLTNWKTFINEQQQSDVNQQHEASNSINAQDLYNEYEDIMEQNNFNWHDIQEDSVWSTIVSELRDRLPNFKFMGKGSFRAVFSIGQDRVVKIDTSDGKAVEMNKNDAKFGRLGDMSQIFPKVYGFDKDYKWIVIEKVTPLKNKKGIIKFFQNPLLQGVDIEDQYEIWKAFLYYYVLKQNNGAPQALERMENRCVSLLRQNLVKPPPFDQVLGRYLKTPFDQKQGNRSTFALLAKAINELNISFSEIQQGNVGLGSDGRFLILDSSVEDDIGNTIASLTNRG